MQWPVDNPKKTLRHGAGAIKGEAHEVAVARLERDRQLSLEVINSVAIIQREALLTTESSEWRL